MVFKYFNASEAAEIGVSLADQFASDVNSVHSEKRSPKAPGSRFQEILARADRDVRPLQLNFYKKAKFANSFKWRLLEKGVESTVADEVTQSLILHLAQHSQDSKSDRGEDATPSPQADSNRLNLLLARAGKAQAAGNNTEAAALYHEFVALVPRHPDALNNLGVALFNLGRYEEAERCYRQAIEIKPDFPGALCNLADVLQGNPLEAEEQLRRALRLNPKHVDARIKLGLSLASTGREHEARACFKKALKIAPGQSDALLGLGRITLTEGRFDEAEALVRRALKSKPKSPGAWAALQGMRKMTSADSDWLKAAREIADSGISLWEESELRFAIGKYYDDVGNYDQAFESVRRANELMKSISPKYDRQAHGAFADDIIRGHNQQALAGSRESGSASIKPIFVVGMPRSGTSLTEQIIASHRDAKGAGETNFWLEAAQAHQTEFRRGILSESVRKGLADDYLRFLERRCPDASRVVDKTPINSDYLGLIHSVFPNARIIRMRRDPIDTGVSIYFQHFSTAMTFSMDLTDIADFSKVHHRLMNHWKVALPQGSILEVPYEELVSNQETWTRKILGFLELEWDPRCLSFYETDRLVSTASAWQVRQKMYNLSVERWRNYEKHLGPLKRLRD
jgi:tetratricopeptide (TPR) repeat protein